MPDTGNARFIQDKAVVTEYSQAGSGTATGLQIGDVIEAIDGVAVPALVDRWAPDHAASNQSTRLRDIAQSMTRGACGAVSVRVTRAAAAVDVNTQRIPEPGTPGGGRRTHDRAGETFQKFSPDVAYLKLSSVQSAQAAKYIESAAGTKGLIIDIRNYPSEFMVFAVGSRLIDRPTRFARFTRGDPAYPGAFHWGPPISLEPALPLYAGKIVILVDELSLSQSEYTAMAFRSAPMRPSWEARPRERTAMSRGSRSRRTGFEDQWDWRVLPRKRPRSESASSLHRGQVHDRGHPQRPRRSGRSRPATHSRPRHGGLGDRTDGQAVRPPVRCANQNSPSRANPLLCRAARKEGWRS